MGKGNGKWEMGTGGKGEKRSSADADRSSGHVQEFVPMTNMHVCKQGEMHPRPLSGDLETTNRNVLTC